VRALFAILAAVTLLAGSARAQSSDSLPSIRFEQGAYPFDTEQEISAVRRAAEIRPMLGLGPDAFRFTFDAGSALRKSYVFEGRRGRSSATLNVLWLDRDGAVGWHPSRHRQFRITLAEYDSLAASIDQELQRGEAYAVRLNAGEEPDVICVDGFDLLAERIVRGREVWMGDSCGVYHPNEEIDRLLRDFVLDRLGG